MLRSIRLSIVELKCFACIATRFLDDLSYITGIPTLLADERLTGGGMHITGSGRPPRCSCRFQLHRGTRMHRRLNLLLYLNFPWEESWGGQLQFWDKDVKRCEASFAPVLNRCVIFETSEISYHGVLPVSNDARCPRKSFATYYYTTEAPGNWEGVSHGTIFRARPNEKLKGGVLMPVEAARRRISALVQRLRKSVKRI